MGRLPMPLVKSKPRIDFEIRAAERNLRQKARCLHGTPDVERSNWKVKSAVHRQGEDEDAAKKDAKNLKEGREMQEESVAATITPHPSW